ncbi:PP2C family protein-serine/threonine phosphatase [uncultured Ruminococcus sp.]|uniref:PP2C family protein-serine/threonine phosphatase n=1 Tax=uncultured Ruminococcus sp. TaxID=165186 RepID=UPI0025E979E3|nr:PP2C family protein-serine/threonine phosphatase [uncultured Ruminococcus sp.]
MKYEMSIKTKTALTTIFFMGILTAAIAGIGYKLYYDNVMESYITYTETVLGYAYEATDEYSFGDMIAEREMPEEYEEMRSELNKVKDCSDIEYLYAIYFEDINDIHSLHYAINAKTQEELASGKPLSEIYSYMGKPCEDGAFEDDTRKTFQNAVMSGERSSMTLKGYSDEYGNMLNGYRVIYDSDDNAVGLLCVEIDINKINVGVKRYINMVILTASVLTAAIVALYLFNTRRYLIRPIVSITENSDAFVKKMQSNSEPEELVYEDVNIRTGGELSLLADNVKSLADSVASYMTNLKAVTAERERIGTELELAHKIQADMLPNIFPPFPERKEFDIYATMTPAKEVGGDFYDFFLIDDDHLGLVMADVSGKGVPAALFMMMSKIVINNLAMQGLSPAKVLEKANEIICSSNDEGMFVTVWFGVLEISTGKVTAANAGHEYPVIRKAGGDFELLKDKHGLVIGGMKGMRYKEYELQLEKGGTLFLYTDGVPEATNSQEELFGTGRLLEAMNRHKEHDVTTLLSDIKNAVDVFVGEAEQFDDLTMLGIIMN